MLLVRESEPRPFIISVFIWGSVKYRRDWYIRSLFWSEL